jgi:hypothetical protein
MTKRSDPLDALKAAEETEMAALNAEVTGMTRSRQNALLYRAIASLLP